MKLKKLTAMALVTAMCATTLFGCGSSAPAAESTPAPAGDDAAAPAESAPAADTAAAGEEEAITAKITVWSPQEDQSEDSGKWLQTQCEAFNAAHPNWDLTFEYGVCSEGDTGTIIPQDPTAAGDVYFFANDQLPQLMSSNAIARIGGSAEEYVKTTNAQTIVDSVTIDGGVYGVPFTSNTWFMYYDKSVFSEEDIKVLDTMLEKGKVAFPLQTGWYIGSFFVANGGTLFGPDGTDEAAGIDFAGDKGTQVADYLIDLVKNKNFVVDADGAGIAGLRDGSVNAIFSGSWDYSTVKEALGDNLGAAQLPSIMIDGSAKQMKSFAGSKAIGVNPNSENMQVAVALAAYLGSEEAQKSHYETRNIIPCNINLLEDATMLADPAVVAQNDTMANTAILQPTVAAMTNYWSASETFTKAITSGEVTHDNAAEKVQAMNDSMNASVVE